MTAGRLLESRVPLAAAPMAGGPTSLALVRAVVGAGAFPFLAAGYKTPEAMALEVEQIRDLGAAFGINLFVPTSARVDPAAFRAYADELQPEADAYGLHLDPEPFDDDDHWPTKLAYLLAHPVPVVSLTFALPSPAEIAALQRRGTCVLASITTPEEARAAAEAGVDGLIAQGFGAGGHSATHDPSRFPAPIATAALVTAVRHAVDLPVIATGGVDGPDAVRSLLECGAESVAVGTLLLRTDEAGTSKAHREALSRQPRGKTVMTRAFTGRPARALRNAFIDRHSANAPVAYPAVHHLTRELRQAAGRAGDAERLHLWAGTGYPSAPEGPAADVVRWLASDV